MTFRILSLDGGGTWALLEAIALEDLYPNATGYDILREFDLVVANSGGSIVLAGLVLNLPLARIRSFFEDEALRKSIFVKKSWVEEELARLPIFPRYSAKEKRIGLGNIMGSPGGIPLSSWRNQPNWPRGPRGAPTGLLVMAFDYDRLREDYLRSYDIGSTGAAAEKMALVDAVHASSDAPVTYFDAPADAGGQRYWDGAMGGYNNPLMAGVVDAISLGADPKEIEILSIGTGMTRLLPPNLAMPDTPPDLLAAKVSPGIVSDAGRAGGCIMDDPPDAATFTAHVLLGNDVTKPGRVVRMNPMIQPVLENGHWDYPAALPKTLFDALVGLGMDALEKPDVDRIVDLGTAWIHQDAPNQPIRMLDDLSCALGDVTYQAARTRWRALTGPAVVAVVSRASATV